VASGNVTEALQKSVRISQHQKVGLCQAFSTPHARATPGQAPGHLGQICILALAGRFPDLPMFDKSLSLSIDKSISKKRAKKDSKKTKKKSKTFTIRAKQKILRKRELEKNLDKFDNRLMHI